MWATPAVVVDTTIILRPRLSPRRADIGASSAPARVDRLALRPPRRCWRGTRPRSSSARSSCPAAQQAVAMASPASNTRAGSTPGPRASLPASPPAPSAAAAARAGRRTASGDWTPSATALPAGLTATGSGPRPCPSRRTPTIRMPSSSSSSIMFGAGRRPTICSTWAVLVRARRRHRPPPACSARPIRPGRPPSAAAVPPWPPTARPTSRTSSSPPRLPRVEAPAAQEGGSSSSGSGSGTIPSTTSSTPRLSRVPFPCSSSDRIPSAVPTRCPKSDLSTEATPTTPAHRHRCLGP
mmetsp:Transcript_18367/g.43542  ORF Transcript_18367/g.43542 Transcript_18367/m.43542 type:complete len:296 (+) Transcript_18367:489-1376(+)